MILTPKNWTSFQHYKNRNPPWIKLHKGLLDDYTFAMLPVASRALAPMLWLLASEAVDGCIRMEPCALAFRLHIPEQEFLESLKPLIINGFMIDASIVLAPCKQLAPELPPRDRDRDRDRVKEQPPSFGVSGGSKGEKEPTAALTGSNP
jgi:hypothetical protein